ncbi:MAG: hypothetical protein IMF19_02625 [Proteobacteria bacterium]|nr:hypothetical protein [Pseudomonadota bacterium]
MKLYELFPNFMKLSYSERAEFIRSYRARRALELEENPRQRKQKSSKIALSDKDKALMKALGITQKDLKTLKESISE